MDIGGALAAHEDRIMATPGVVGVGVGEEAGRPAIVVFVEALTPDNASPEKLGLPASVEGHPLVVREIGTVTAHA